MIAEEHHGLLAQLVRDVHHLLGKLCDLAALERLKILVFFARNPVLVVVVALINDIFGPEFVSGLFFKLFENIRRDGCGIAVPVDVFFPAELVKDERKLVEERCEAQNIHIVVLPDEAPQALHGKGVRFRLAHVEGDLVLKVLPAVRHGVVHMHRIPDEVREEAHRVFVIRLRRVKDDTAAFRVIAPCLRRNRRSRAAVDDLPPAADIVARVDLHQLRADALHERNGQRAILCGVKARHDVALLHLLGVRPGPVVILAGRVIGSVDLCARIAQLLRKIRAVAVADGVRAPALHDLQRLRHHVHIRRDRHAAGQGSCMSGLIVHRQILLSPCSRRSV